MRVGDAEEKLESIEKSAGIPLLNTERSDASASFILWGRLRPYRVVLGFIGSRWPPKSWLFSCEEKKKKASQRFVASTPLRRGRWTIFFLPHFLFYSFRFKVSLKKKSRRRRRKGHCFPFSFLFDETMQLMAFQVRFR